MDSQLFIHKVRLQNFRNFTSKDFEFKSQFSVIIGDNGKGKSSLLQSVRIAAGAFLLGIDDLSQYDKYHIQKEDVKRVDVGNTFVPERDCSVEAWGNINNTQLHWKRTLPKLGGRTDTKDAKDIISLSTALNNKINLEKLYDVDLPVICFFSTRRLWGSTKQTTSLKKKGFRLKDGYTRCLDDNSDKESALSWIRSRDYKRLKGDNEETNLLQAVLNAIAACVPNWTSLEWSEDENDLSGIFVKENTEPNRVPLFYLSDGLRTMASMVAEIAYRCVSLNPHLGVDAVLKSKGIVLIDELDMHIHPNWQKDVVKNFKSAFPNIQFITTSHSPFIVQSLKSDELIILDENVKKDIDPFAKGIEEVSAHEMGVENISRSKEFLEREAVAAEYYKLIAEGKNSNNDAQVMELRAKLNEYEEKYGSDPAFVASLKIERRANGL